MSRWGDTLLQPVVWFALLGQALGALTGWATGGQASMARVFAIAVLGILIQWVLARHATHIWVWIVLPLHGIAGWIATAAPWHPALPTVVLAWSAAVGAVAWLDGGHGEARRAVARWLAGAYGVLLLAVGIRALPVWCLAGLLALPCAVRALRSATPEESPGVQRRWVAFVVAFTEQTAVGLAVAGLVRW